MNFDKLSKPLKFHNLLKLSVKDIDIIQDNLSTYPHIKHLVTQS